MKKFLSVLSIFLILFSTGCGENDPLENTVVIVRYKALPNKSVDAFNGLKNLIEEVQKEDHFVSLRLHVDQNDNTNILLYEEWDDELYYRNQHMQTPHIQEFILQSQKFLAGPPEITYWKVNQIYE